jgi:S1-C subfamily serine protease
MGHAPRVAEPGTKQKWLAIALAGVAAVLSATALVVVLARGERSAAAPIPRGPHVVDRTVAGADLAQLRGPGALAPSAGGVAVTDAAVAARLGLAPRDVVTAVEGRAVRDAFQVDEAIESNLPFAGERTIYVELARGDLLRWRVDAGARHAWWGATHTALPPIDRVPLAPSPPRPLDRAFAAVQRVDDTHVVVPRAALDALLAQPTELARDARIVPSYANGAPHGLKLYAIRAGTPMALLGLQNGDTLLAINGFDLSTPDRALEAYTSLRKASRFDVSLERRGQPVALEITIK